MPGIHCIVVTPEETALDEKADFVALPLYDGEIGIAAGRSPMIGRLGFGELRVKAGGKELRYYVDGGFVQVAGNVVSVLTNRAIPADELDSAADQKHLDEARKRPAHTPELMQARDRLVDQARGRLRVARRGG